MSLCKAYGLRLLMILAGVCSLGSLYADEATAPQSDEKPLAYWIEQLDSDQFLRRQAASQRLLKFGNEAVAPLAEATSRGRLELTERAVNILETLALKQAPDDEAGAWGALEGLAKQASGSASTRASAALANISKEREAIALERLTMAGVKLGFREFVIDARSLNENVVLIDASWDGDVAALRWLRWIRGIAYAVVQGPAVDAEVFNHLILMPDLRTISISEGKIENDIFTPLSKMSRIDELEFRYVRLSAADAEKIVKLPVRVQLSLMGTGIPRESEKMLRESMPALNIILKEGGFLGVRCNNFSPVCQIDTVVPGGAAEKAGLEPGDVITDIDGTPIARFDDLQMEVGRHPPDEEIEITFDRRGMIKKVKLKLMRMKTE